MPYKKVVAIGDSFTRGDELADCKDQLQNVEIQPKQFSSNTWPALIAKGLSLDYECIAIGGRGNQWMSMIVSKLIETHKDCLFIVNWSWFERFDYINTESQQWTVTHPRHNNKLDHYFYRHIDSEIWNLHRNLQQIHSTICLLDQNNISFIMTCLDPMLYLEDKSATALQEQVSHRIVNFWGYTFLDWAKHKQFPIGTDGHPLEKAHIEAAQYINMTTTEGKINGH